MAQNHGLDLIEPEPARQTRVPRPVVYALVALSVSQLALTLAAMFFAYTAIHQSELKWCGTLGVFHRTYKQTPPTTPAGVEARRQIDALYAEFDCSKVEEKG
jgi:hypothetical protein